MLHSEILFHHHHVPEGLGVFPVPEILFNKYIFFLCMEECFIEEFVYNSNSIP